MVEAGVPVHGEVIFEVVADQVGGGAIDRFLKGWDGNGKLGVRRKVESAVLAEHATFFQHSVKGWP